MADNFDITQGAGKTIRAVDRGDGTLVQVVRLDASFTTDLGVTNYRVMSANTTNSTNLKASAALVWGFHLYNSNAAARTLKLYNKATAPTIGSDTPAMTFTLKAADWTQLIIPWGNYFNVGLGFGLTTGVADSDTGAVATNEISGTILWN